MKYEIDIDPRYIKEGYIPIAFRAPKIGEVGISAYGRGCVTEFQGEGPRLILEPKKVWRDAKIADIDKGYQAMVKDYDSTGSIWLQSLPNRILVGWVNGEWVVSGLTSLQASWRMCQVLAPAGS